MLFNKHCETNNRQNQQDANTQQKLAVSSSRLIEMKPATSTCSAKINSIRPRLFWRENSV